MGKPSALLVILALIGSLLPLVTVDAQQSIVRADQFVFGAGSIPTSRRFLSGTGSPESVVTAPVGTVYIRTDGGAGTSVYFKESGTAATGWIAAGSASSSAPISATYITQTCDASLTAEQCLSALASAVLISTTGTGVVSAYTGTSCTNQFPRSLSALAVATCNSVSLTLDVTGTLPVANGGTGVTGGTSGGILGFTAAGTLASSAALALNQLVLGGGAGATPTTLGSLGTTTTVLHGNAAGAPSFGAVVLTTDVAGILPTANGGTGQNSTATFPTTGAVATDVNAVTFTNKTIDAEGAGNSLTTVEKRQWQVARCDNVTATSPGWSFETTNPAAPACVTGTNIQKGVLDFADGASILSAQTYMNLPSDFTGNIDAKFVWFTSATTGSVVWQLATICVANGETGDPAFNTASTVTDTAQGTANQYNDASITSVTITGCAAGETMYLRLFRDPAHGSDTLAATARLAGFELTYRRAQ